jgi:type I restriction enzyme R subunit
LSNHKVLFENGVKEETMTNFDLFLSEPKFAAFAEVAVSAEKILYIDPAACVLNCRRAIDE